MAQTQSRKSAPKKGILSRIKSIFGGDPAPASQRGGQSASSSKPAGRQNGSQNQSGQGQGKRRRRSRGGSSQGQSQGGRSRGPELREVTGTRLYVGNLSYDSTEHDLEELFRGVGTVESAEVVTHSRTQRSKGFAFVEMSALDQAQRAAEQLHDMEFMGRKIVVTGAKPKQD